MATETATSFACELPVFYATTEGQTRRIAERLAAVLLDRGFDSRAIDIAGSTDGLDWSRVVAALVGASLHIGRHQREAAAFVEANAAQLNAIPSAFFSVSLSAASQNQEEVAAARRIAGAFPREHGWTPGWIVSLAGRLAYTQYGFFTRMLMKRIARKEGAPTDASRDYELTDWDAAEQLARDVAGAVRGRADAGRSASVA